MDAFHEGKTRTNVEMDNEELVDDGVMKDFATKKNYHQIPTSAFDSEEQMRLQIELKRLEYEHTLSMAEIQRQKEEVSLSFEKQKYEASLQKLNDGFKTQIETLQNQIQQIQISHTQATETNKKTKTKMDTLDADIRLEYVDLIESFLELDDDTLHKRHIQNAHKIVTNLMKEIKSFAFQIRCNHNDFKEYQHLLKIRQILDSYLEKINERYWYEGKMIDFEIESTFKEELEKVVEN